MSLSPSSEPDQLMLVPASESEENNQPNSDKQIFVLVSDTRQVLFIKDSTTEEGKQKDFALLKLDDQSEDSRLGSFQLIPTYRIHPSLVESVKAILKMMDLIQEQKDLAIRRYIRGEDPRLGLSAPVIPTFKVHPSLVESLIDVLTKNNEKILKSLTLRATPFHRDPTMVQKMRHALTWHVHLPNTSTAVPTSSSTATNNEFDDVSLLFKPREHTNIPIRKNYEQLPKASISKATGSTGTNPAIDAVPLSFKLPVDVNIHTPNNYEHLPKTPISIPTGSAAKKDVLDAIPLSFDFDQTPRKNESARPQGEGEIRLGSRRTWMKERVPKSTKYRNRDPRPGVNRKAENYYHHKRSDTVRGEDFELCGIDLPKTASKTTKERTNEGPNLGSPSGLQSSSKILGSCEGSSKIPGSGVDCWSMFADAGSTILLKCLRQSLAGASSQTLAAGEGSGKTLAAGQGSKKTLEKRKRDSLGESTHFLEESYHEQLLSSDEGKKKKKMDQGRSSSGKQIETAAAIPNQTEDPAAIRFEEALSLFMPAGKTTKNVEGNSKRKQTVVVATPEEALSDGPVPAESKRKKLSEVLERLRNKKQS